MAQPVGQRPLRAGRDVYQFGLLHGHRPDTGLYGGARRRPVRAAADLRHGQRRRRPVGVHYAGRRSRRRSQPDQDRRHALDSRAPQHAAVPAGQRHGVVPHHLLQREPGRGPQNAARGADYAQLRRHARRRDRPGGVARLQSEQCDRRSHEARHRADVLGVAANRDCQPGPHSDGHRLRHHRRRRDANELWRHQPRDGAEGPRGPAASRRAARAR